MQRSHESAFSDGFRGEVFGEPEVGDVGRAEAEDVGQGTADLAEAEVDADLFEDID